MLPKMENQDLPHPDEEWFLSEQALREMFGNTPIISPYELDTDEYLPDAALENDGPTPQGNDLFSLTQRGNYTDGDDYFAYRVSHDVDYAFRAQETLHENGSLYSVQAVKIWDTPSYGASEENAITLGYYDEQDTAVQTLNRLTHLWNADGLDTAMNEAANMANTLGSRPLYSGDKLFLEGPADPFSVPPPLDMLGIEDADFQVTMDELHNDPTFQAWRDADVEQLAALLEAETLGQANWDMAWDELPDEMTLPELDSAFVEACRIADLEADEVQAYVLDRLPFQAFESIGVDAGGFDPTLEVPPMLENGTAFWVGVYEIEPDTTYAACLLSLDDFNDAQPQAHLAVCQIGDYASMVDTSQSLLGAAERGGLAQCLAVAEEFGRSQGDLETVWTEGRGITLNDEVAVGLATHLQQAPSDLDF